jgi:hypothetical protein
MTTAADDPAVEEAFEACLAGRPVPEGAAGLAAFTGAVRASASRPGRPNAALADLLATGLLTDQSAPSAWTARSAPPPPEVRGRSRRRIAMFFPALLAKILGAGAVAQAATGVGVALVAFTGAGTAGALPDPVQHTFAGVVATVGLHVEDPHALEDGTTPTPDDDGTAGDALPTAGTGGTATGTDGVGDDVSDDVGDDATGDTNQTGTTAAGGDGTAGTAGDAGRAGLVCKDGEAFGACVSRTAQTGGVDGQAVAQAAHDRNDARRSAPSTTAPTPSAPVVGHESDHAADSADDSAATVRHTGSPAGQRGNSGSSSGSGPGNSGNGGSGRGNSGHGG